MIGQRDVLITESCCDSVSGDKVQGFDWDWEADIRVLRDEARTLNELSTLTLKLSRWKMVRGEKVRQGAGCTNKQMIDQRPKD